MSAVPLFRDTADSHRSGIGGGRIDTGLFYNRRRVRVFGEGRLPI